MNLTDMNMSNLLLNKTYNFTINNFTSSPIEVLTVQEVLINWCNTLEFSIVRNAIIILIVLFLDKVIYKYKLFFSDLFLLIWGWIYIGVLVGTSVITIVIYLFQKGWFNWVSI